MPHYPKENPGDQITLAGSFNAAFIIMYAHALGMLVFLRKDFGREGLGLAGLLTVFLILLWGCQTASFPMLVFLLVWFAAVLCQRVNQFINWQRGIRVHSRYSGFPFVSKRLFPWVSDLNARGVDGFICLAVGGLLFQFDKPLGLFVAFGVFSILFVEGMSVETTKRKLQAMHDAEIEMQYLNNVRKTGRF